ncbi:hypothetical protein ABH905_003755 [Pseudomonas frederiksbergensis]
MSGNTTRYGRRDVLKAGALIAGGSLVYSVASPPQNNTTVLAPPSVGQTPLQEYLQCLLYT